ncbi:MAG: DUF1592 domain-containing protein [Zetaproteobacteria bacterium]|nr:DUF1592 domain-containing protein [Zetaproteobacteria bacterium]
MSIKSLQKVVLFTVILKSASGCFKNKTGADNLWSNSNHVESSNHMNAEGESNANGGSSDDPIAPGVVESFNPQVQNAAFIEILKESQTASPGCEQSSPSAPEARILTADEYVAAVNFAFDMQLDGSFAQSYLPADNFMQGYPHLRQANVMSKERLSAFFEAAYEIAGQMGARSTQILNCNSGNKSQCLKTWLEQTLPKLWRRNSNTSEIEREVEHFTREGSGTDPFIATITRILVSPYFLYRMRIGEQGQLTSWEVATALSDALWAGKFDETLADHALSNRLSTPEQIQREITRMMQSAQFYAGTKRFTQSWLETSLLVGRGMKPNKDLQLEEIHLKYLAEETTAFLYYLMANGQTTTEDFFNSDFTFTHRQVANLYGMKHDNASSQIPGMPSGYVKANFNAPLGGLLSQPSVALSISSEQHTNIPLRGKKILSHFMCMYLETPENLADNINMTVFDKNLSALDALNEVTAKEPCASCHRTVNGPGAALETLSPIGRTRTLDDHSKPAKSDGWLPSILGGQTDVHGVKELSAALGNATDTGVCATVQVFRHIYARLEKKEDKCNIARIYHSAHDQGKNAFQLKSVFSAILSSDEFLQRK